MLIFYKKDMENVIYLSKVCENNEIKMTFPTKYSHKDQKDKH